MSIVRQLPELYIRGSIASQTMSKIATSDRKEVEKVVDMILRSEELSPTRRRFVRILSTTIRSDYYEDPMSAEQEYIISAWRAATYLLVDHAYSYRCGHCDSTHYTSKSNTKAIIDRQFTPCPNCDYVVSDGQYVSINDTPENGIMSSCIIPIRGKKRVTNQQMNAVLSDPIQFKKFFTKFINNYLQQILNENAIIVHKHVRRMETGPNDYLACKAVIGIFKRYRVKHRLLENNDGHYKIICDHFWLPMSVIREIIDVVYVAFGSNVLSYTTDRILIPNLGARATMIEMPCYDHEMVRVASDVVDENGNQLQRVTEIVDDEDCGDQEYLDYIQYISSHLPSDLSRQIFSILKCTGKHYITFVDTMGRGACTAHGVPIPIAVARYLGCRATDVNRTKMRVRSLMYDALPTS